MYKQYQDPVKKMRLNTDVYTPPYIESYDSYHLGIKATFHNVMVDCTQSDQFV